MAQAEIPSFLMQGVVYLAAAVVAVPLSKRLGLGSVLGYLIAGVAIGPWGLGLIKNVESVLHFAEFGVVMMLFLIGLELEPKKLWQLRKPIFGLGALQVLLTVLAIACLAFAFNYTWQVSIIVAMSVAMSSTAIAMQVIQDRGLLTEPIGEYGFSVLLFQDLAVIPILMCIALIAPHQTQQGVDWLPIIRAISLIAFIVITGNYFLRPILRYIANTGMREIFIAFSLFLVMGVAMLMQLVGLSPALGAFLAGVLLADSEYRQELELDIEPFKGLLLGLFFIAVGMSINIGLMVKQPALILGLALAFVTIKLLLLYGLVRLNHQNKTQSLLFALILSQIGEFSFVIFNTAFQQQLLSSQQVNILNAVVAISMLTTPLLLFIYQYLTNKQLNQPANYEAISENQPIIVGGYGRFGQIIVRLLQGIGIASTVIENNPNQIELLRRFGNKAYYGDISRPDVLEAAGIKKARLLVIAIDDSEAALATAKYVKQHYPKVNIVARARNRTDTLEYLALDIECVRETFYSALSATELVLANLGFRRYQAKNIVWKFKEHDEAVMLKTVAVKDDEKQRISNSLQSRQDLLDLLTIEINKDKNIGNLQTRDSGFESAQEKISL